MEMKFGYLEKKFLGRILIKLEEESLRLVKFRGRRRREVEFKMKKFLESLRIERVLREVKVLKEMVLERLLLERLILEIFLVR